MWPTIDAPPPVTLSDYIGKVLRLELPPDEIGVYSLAYSIKHDFIDPIRRRIADEPQRYLAADGSVRKFSGHRDYADEMAPVLGNIVLTVLPGAKPAVAGEGAAATRGEILSRLGTSRESAARLGRKAAEAETHLGVHGVSVSASSPTAPASQAAREVVESEFRVHNTPTRNDPLHRTVELPKPVTQEVADIFNRIFGR